MCRHSASTLVSGSQPGQARGLPLNLGLLTWAPSGEPLRWAWATVAHPNKVSIKTLNCNSRRDCSNLCRVLEGAGLKRGNVSHYPPAHLDCIEESLRNWAVLATAVTRLFGGSGGGPEVPLVAQSRLLHAVVCHLFLRNCTSVSEDAPGPQGLAGSAPPGGGGACGGGGSGGCGGGDNGVGDSGNDSTNLKQGNLNVPGGAGSGAVDAASHGGRVAGPLSPRRGGATFPAARPPSRRAPAR
jgi:hypothetical protein